MCEGSSYSFWFSFWKIEDTVVLLLRKSCYDLLGSRMILTRWERELREVSP